MKSQFISQPNSDFRLGDFLKQSFADSRWTIFRAAVAFAKYSGTKHIRDLLSDFSRRAKVDITIGIDAGGTSVEGLMNLMDALENRGNIWIFRNANSSTFHPKIYLFRNEELADLVIGSGNLTEGGLFTNYEGSMKVELILKSPDHAALLASIERALNIWSTPKDGLCYRLDKNFLNRLVDHEDVQTEAQTRETEEGRSKKAEAALAETRIFKRVGVPAAPKVSKQSPDLPKEILEEEDKLVVRNPPPSEAQLGRYRAY